MTRLVVATLLLAAIALFVHFRARDGATVGLRVVSRAALNRNASVAVVEVEGRRLLVGAGANGVCLLSELPRDTDDGRGEVVEVTLAPEVEVPAPVARSSTVPMPVAPAPSRGATTMLDRIRSMTVRTADPAARRDVVRRPGGRPS